MSGHVIKARLRITTPMFLGGANQEADAVRPPSIKGALRFWWRALNWKAAIEAKGDDAAALVHLHDKEGDLFGIAGVGKGGSHQSRVLIEVADAARQGAAPHDERMRNRHWPINNTGAGFLGFGLFESGKKEKHNYQPHREAIAEGEEFELMLRFKPGTAEGDRDSVVQALEAWSLFGSLGSRARKGFGSVTLVELDGKSRTWTPEFYSKEADAFVSKYEGVPRPPYTAFSGESAFAVKATGRSGRESLENAGLAFKKHRGQESELRGRAKLGFGLPLKGVADDERRGGPLFFHVQQCGSEFSTGVLFLPAAFWYEEELRPRKRGQQAFRVDERHVFDPAAAFVKGGRR